MRYGVISDVHGNVHALRAVIQEMTKRGVDDWLSVGDLIGYGPNPNECVELVAGLDAIGVAGNHELIALGRIEGRSSSRRAQESHLRTRDQLRPETLEYLGSLPSVVTVHDMVLAHGSLSDPEEYVRTAVDASNQLSQLREERPQSRLLLLGNTHRQLLCGEQDGAQLIHTNRSQALRPDQRYVANPGSVGQSRQWEWPPRARAMVLDADTQQLTFLSVNYDLFGAYRHVRRDGMSYRTLQSPPPLRPALRRRVDRVLGRRRGGPSSSPTGRKL